MRHQAGALSPLKNRAMDSADLISKSVGLSGSTELLYASISLIASWRAFSLMLMPWADLSSNTSAIFVPPLPLSEFEGSVLTVYFLALLLLAGFSGAFFGRPTGLTTRIFSKSSLVYKASCEKGLHPARRSRLFTVSFGSSSFSAISEMVKPFISFFIGSLAGFLDIVPKMGQILYRRLAKMIKIIKNVPEKELFILTYCPVLGTI
jgi:hypothetical protein